MNVHSTKHPQAGQRVELNDRAGDLLQGEVEPGVSFVIEDWADRVIGGAWTTQQFYGNWAAKNYATRCQTSRLPMDDECVYGKIGSLGYIVHVSEFA